MPVTYSPSYLSITNEVSMKYLYQHNPNGFNRKARRLAASLARRYPKSPTAVAHNKIVQSAPLMTPAMRINARWHATYVER